MPFFRTSSGHPVEALHEETWFFQTGILNSDLHEVATETDEQAIEGIDNIDKNKDLAGALAQSVVEFPDTSCRCMQCFVPCIRSHESPDPTERVASRLIDPARSGLLFFLGALLYTVDDIFLDYKVWWDFAVTVVLALLVAVMQCFISTLDFTCLCSLCCPCLCLCSWHCCCSCCNSQGVNETTESGIQNQTSNVDIIMTNENETQCQTGQCRCICAPCYAAHRNPQTCFRWSRAFFTVFASGFCVAITAFFAHKLPSKVNAVLEMIMFAVLVVVFQLLFDKICSFCCSKNKCWTKKLLKKA